MKDLTRTMEITMADLDINEEGEPVDPGKKAETVEGEKVPSPSVADETPATAAPAPSAKATEAGFASEASSAQPIPTPTSSSGTSTPRRGIPTRQMIMDKSEEDARLEAAGISQEERDLRKKEKKKGGLTKEQREQLAEYELERKKIRDERVETLSKKLIDRISVWTETDKGKATTKAFEDKTKYEVENLKMESFGIEILHAVGQTYLQKATALIKSQKLMGLPGFFSRLKDKGTMAKDTWNTISSAIDAQMTMEEMAKAEEKGGEDWTDEKKADYERKVTGKILTAAWRGSRFEITQVLRDVCDKVLNDKSIPLSKRLERAQGLVILGNIYAKVMILLRRLLRTVADGVIV